MKAVWIFVLATVTLSLTGCRAARLPHPSGATYYVDAGAGNDEREGTSPGTAWKSLERVNAATFKPGDRILFKRGTRHLGRLQPKGSGRAGSPIVIDAYGKGALPRIDAEGAHLETLLLYNVEHWEVNNLELTNNGPERQPYRAGVRVKIDNFGTAHHIHLKNLFVHDVNGSNVKAEGGGTGITADNSGDRIPSRFDDLLIESCRLLRTDRDAIAVRSEHKDRQTNWFPNRNVVIRGNVLEDFGGDGIVPRGCSGALIEYNTLRNGRMRCPDYAAGIWPHSSDSTIIQFNEVSGMLGTKDGMAFDSDGNTRHTLFQYNYSHDNDGGFYMVCGGETNKGNVFRYNVSQNDGHRLFYITGPMTGIEIYNNVVYTRPGLDVWAVWPGGGQRGFADSVRFANNIFYFEGKAEYNFGGITSLVFENNLFFGNHVNPPADIRPVTGDPLWVSPGGAGDGFPTLSAYQLQPGSPCIDAGVSIPGSGGRDMLGHVVPAGPHPDCGAFEYGATAASR